MPNGDPNWGRTALPKLEEFFGRISTTLEGFAKKHNLTIIKYYHQGQDWTFRFKHPNNGLGQIHVLKHGDAKVWIAADWTIDDYDELTTYSKRTEVKESSLDTTDLTSTLSDMLKYVVRWQKHDLKPSKDNSDLEWHDTWTKEEFEKLNDEYPVPNVE